jgi:hypothetical protein
VSLRDETIYLSVSSPTKAKIVIAQLGRHAATTPLRAPQSRGRDEQEEYDHDDDFDDEPDYADYYAREGYEEEEDENDEFYDIEKDKASPRRQCWRICRIVTILYVSSPLPACVAIRRADGSIEDSIARHARLNMAPDRSTLDYASRRRVRHYGRVGDLVQDAFALLHGAGLLPAG